MLQSGLCGSCQPRMVTILLVQASISMFILAPAVCHQGGRGSASCPPDCTMCHSAGRRCVQHHLSLLSAAQGLRGLVVLGTQPAALTVPPPSSGRPGSLHALLLQTLTARCPGHEAVSSTP